MTVRVRVTQDDIDAGVRDDCSRCPVALAISRATGALDVEVEYGVVAIAMRPGDDIAHADLPEEVTDIVLQFDAGYPMSPFEFDLPLPTEPEVAASVEGD